ncbi:hypothetical protein TMM008_01580 [Pseudomonas sp. 008]|nr:hypothetical protein TMM008_01580 [Pseudomonas sp. 008]
MNDHPGALRDHEGCQHTVYSNRGVEIQVERCAPMFLRQSLEPAAWGRRATQDMYDDIDAAPSALHFTDDGLATVQRG